MNDIFNFSRFVKYAKAQLILQRKLFLLIISGGFLALFFFTLILFATNSRWDKEDWSILFLMSGAISALLFAGHAFPFLRTKEACQNTLMIPASTLEKFTYEFVLKIVLFTLLYPVLFKLMAGTVLPLAEFINPERAFVPFSFDPIIHTNKEYLLPTAVLGYLFTVSLAFAGASALKRYPLIKTIVIVGIIILVGVGYFYLLFGKLHLKNGISYVANYVIADQDSALIWLYYFLCISFITAWVYAFFNLKEREV